MLKTAEQYVDLFFNRSPSEDEFFHWSQYRKQLTDFIISHIKPDSSIIIFGAGRCNDIDLKKLLPNARSITLSDFSDKSLAHACETYHLKPNNQLILETVDYVGIKPNDYIFVFDHLIDNLKLFRRHVVSEQYLSECLRYDLKDVYTKYLNYSIPYAESKADYSIVVGVHSQLNNAWNSIWDLIRSDLDMEPPIDVTRALTESVQQHTGDIVRAFNAYMINRTRHGIIYGYENSLRSPSSNDKTATISGARQAAEESLHYKTLDKVYLAWPLSESRGITFDMCIRYIRL